MPGMTDLEMNFATYVWLLNYFGIQSLDLVVDKGLNGKPWDQFCQNEKPFMKGYVFHNKAAKDENGNVDKQKMDFGHLSYVLTAPNRDNQPNAPLVTKTNAKQKINDAKLLRNQVAHARVLEMTKEEFEDKCDELRQLLTEILVDADVDKGRKREMEGDFLNKMKEPLKENELEAFKALMEDWKEQTASKEELNVQDLAPDKVVKVNENVAMLYDETTAIKEYDARHATHQTRSADVHQINRNAVIGASITAGRIVRH